MSRVTLVLAVMVAAGAVGAADLVVYDDALGAGFEDWSWATHDLASSAPVHSGSFAVSFEPDGWAALYFHAQGTLEAADYEACRFWLHGGTSGGQELRLRLWLGNAGVGDIALDAYLPGGILPAGSWVEVTVPLADLGLTVGPFDGIVLQADTAGDQGRAHLDDLVLEESSSPPPPGGEITVAIQALASGRAIDPRIYGVNFGDFGAGVPPYPVRRWGGNSTTRYSWRADVHNTASDWFFMNIPSDHPDPSQLPDGSEADLFVTDSFAVGAEPIMTLPTIGWAPREERVKQWGFSVADYGAQDLTECTYFGGDPPAWCQPDAGNGECASSGNGTGFCVDGQIVGNDPTDTSIPITPDYVGDWVDHLVATFGAADAGGVRLYALDNEPMLWNSTHRDVHPAPATYDEVWQEGLAVAREIKERDPGAVVLGPVVWGWCAFFTSAADAASGVSCVDGPDRQTHGGLPFLEWYVAQICAEQTATGVRPVDLLDVHFYPQGGVSGLSGDGEDPATAARRLRSVKELYDPAYVSESWINAPVELVPMLRRWIDARCPGVGLALTEYRWGADDGPTGALAQAEVLAILGREGVDVATRWVAPEPGSRTEDAFRLFLDYDGAGAAVVGTSVPAASSDVDAVGAYAVRAPADRLLVVLVNKDLVSRPTTLSFGVASTGAARLFGFDGSNPLGPLGTLPVAGSTLALDLAPRSAILVELPLPSSLIFADGFESGGTSAW